MKVQDNVELPEPVTLVGETLHDAVVLVARATTPVKPLRPVTVIEEVAAVPGVKFTLSGLALIVKSCTV